MSMAPVPRSSKRQLGLDVLFHALFWASALLVLLILGGLIVLMATGGWKALTTFGLSFFDQSSWNPVKDRYGALAPLLGTVLSTVIALLLAIPLAFGTAFWLTNIASARLAAVIGTAVQLLAAVPSIIFGMWGFFTIVPLVARYVQPFVNHHFRHAFILGPLLKGPPIGTGVMTSGIVLAVMIAPFITAVMCDVFGAVPPMLRESAYGLGATRWEVMRKIIAPWSRNGMIGAIVLGMGRALGETMAVTFVIGNVTSVGWSLFAPRSTVASLIALQFPESPAGSLRLSSLMALGFTLMLLSCASLVVARCLRGRRQ
ncbi:MULTISPECIES: phosphate ABC transporter permease subunit PstC [unclassified Saccharibacter]|uniref:phosphate ABC transporter permease subunit PstC n=1 Tax=unclassified Saccharibacter TaxID=2648722 RepID=UPI001327B8A9|nr:MULTISPECIES: phosphate ABC transporter permease subunit PstC [unclassified Saccharibacter]MXV36756.1 phosphate ABC transporter permease subunit PstC [Saccharibacter sp. EH611]MXV58248.1 phosphate ABC transporter permease subunit PstC [Saccharibacter sp. EH70]MXV65704.1 phosphate ABC transporter permease subunit PstC [Saccharibacter sp. EH60]